MRGFCLTLLYLTEPGSLLSRDGNRLIIRKDKESVVKSIGLETVEGIVVIGACHLATGLATELLERDIPVTWLSSMGRFFGRLEPTTGFNIERQLVQFELHRDCSFRLALSKSWIAAKLKNCRVLLRRYNRERELTEVEQLCCTYDALLQKVSQSSSIEELMGYEGVGSRYYLKALSLLLPEEFRFEGRSKRPPRDPFNSMLSFGYTLLLYEIYTALTGKGLHPYLGFMHQPKRGHPALASDLMEEWRPIVVDSLAMGLVTTNQIKFDDFTCDQSGNGGVYLTREASKGFIEKFEKKLRSHNQYLTYVDYPLTFRESMSFQVGALVKALENADPTLYRSVVLR